MAGWTQPDPGAMRQLTLPGLLRQPRRRRVATPTEQALDCARTRLVLFGLIFLTTFATIGIRTVWLTVFSNPDDPAVTRAAQISMGRADIVDRNGAILATSLPTFSSCAQTRAIDDPVAVARAIVTVLPELNADRLAESFAKRKGCVPVKRHLTPKQHYALNRLGIGAIEFSRDERRVYPQGALTAHVVGTTDIDNIGTSGVEKKMDKALREDGQPLQLTLDIRVQHILQHELALAVEDFQAIGGAGMVMDVQTGGIVAMVSLPDFNPAEIGTADAAARFNRATLGVYELGSTFKLFTAAQALELGLIGMTQTVNTVDPIRIGRHSIRDFHPEHRWLTLPEIIMVSSNLGAARLAERIGPARQQEFLQQLGMFKPVPVELPETGKPLMPAVWGDVATMTIGFGHGIAAAPLQLVRSVATVSNGGLPVTPTLLKVEEHQPDPNTVPLLSRSTVARMRAMMRLVVAAGTAKAANAEGYQVGGKTGTAEKIGAHGYNRNARLSSFVGVFPMAAPRYVVFAMLDEPKGNKKTYGFATGGWTAAPVVGKVIAASAPLLGVAPMDPLRRAAADSQVLQPVGQKLLAELIKAKEYKPETEALSDDDATPADTIIADN